MVSEKVAQLADALAAYHPRFGILWRLGVETGLRVSDLLQLQPCDLKHLLHVVERKTGKIRKIDLSPEIRAVIREYVKDYALRKGDFLFWSRRGVYHKPMSRQWAHRVIRREALSLGFTAIGTHSMRKTFAVDKFRRIRSLEAVQRVLNHTHVSTTLLYLQDLLADA